MADPVLLANLLDLAALTRTSLSPLTARHRLDEEMAYRVQAALVARRCARGESIIGLKMGFTSEAMRRQMNVDRPNCGWLTDAMLIDAREALSLDRYIHPRVEPEVAIRLGRDLAWPVDRAAAAEAVDACAPALEIVDSRFHNYQFKWADNAADNSSAAALVIGAWRPGLADLAELKVRLHIDGLVAEQGDTTSVLGHPLNALVEAAKLAGAQGQALRAGMIVLTGGITAAPFLRAGQSVCGEIEGLGDVILSIAG